MDEKQRTKPLTCSELLARVPPIPFSGSSCGGTTYLRGGGSSCLRRASAGVVSRRHRVFFVRE